MIGRTISHYRILSELGAGGMGVVYRAEDTKLGRAVALKFLPPELTRDEAAKKRLVHEARAISQLQHHNICTIHEINETDDGRMFICMDYYDGETLKDRLSRGPLNVEAAIDITSQVARGLEEAHRRGVVHRDIKPANVVVTNDGVAKILDFGLAKLMGQTRVTKTGSAVGTAAYMSPEQVRGEDLDARSDIFSLGVMFYELLTGATPFDAPHEPAVMHKILNVAPPPLRHSGVKLASRLEPIIGKMLAKEPAERHQTVREAITDLGKLASNDVGSAQPGGWPGRRLAFSAMAVVLVIGAILWWVFGRDRPAQTGPPRLAILYFETVGEPNDPRRMGEIATNLLITDLSESKYVKVVSSQRLYDILKKLGKEGVKVVDRDTATRVAREAGATQMLVGSIIRSQGRVEVTSQLIDPLTGDLRDSQRISGTEEDNVFTLVDRLSAEIRSDLDLPRAANREPVIGVADVTTHSAEAYRYYLEGWENYYQVKWTDAAASFRKAVAEDSTFAKGWLALTDRWLREYGSPSEVGRALIMAQRHQDKLSEGERRLLHARTREVAGDVEGAARELEDIVASSPDEKTPNFDLHELYRHTDVPKAIACMQRVLAIDPLDRRAHNALVYSYASIGQHDQALRSLNEYIRLAPNDANAFDTQGDIYGRNGERGKALESYSTAVRIDSSFSLSWCKLGYLQLLEGNEPQARAAWNRVLELGDPAFCAAVRLYAALLPLYHGRTKDAVRSLTDAIAADTAAGYHDWFLAAKWMFLGCVHAERGEWPAADASFARMEPPFDRDPDLIGLRAAILAEMDPRRAERDFKVLVTLPDYYGLQAIANCWLEMARGRNDVACDVIDKSKIEALTIGKNYTRGVAYLRAGRYQQSIARLEIARAAFPETDRLELVPMWIVRIHYYLGYASEANGDREKAIQEYQVFIERWKNADSRLADQVNDARQRLKKLRA